jgi:hypoxanthine phosphoribosyltransferase
VAPSVSEPPETGSIPARMSDVVTVLFGREDIRRRIEELGRPLTGDYEGRAPVLISVLKGGSMFLADLIRSIGLPLAIDYMSISRYGGAAESMGRVRIVKDLDEDVGGRDVIVVEDIVDTGLTLGYLISVLESRNPASIQVCALLDKSARRIAPIEIRYRGFECPDVFVVGYGLDYRERYRNIPELLAVQDLSALEEDPDVLLPYLPEVSGGR